MNIAFAQHRLWQLWHKHEPIPERPPLWPHEVKAHFFFENEKREPEVHEVWAAPIVNGKPELKAWTYDVKACSVKIRDLLLSNAEIQEGWPSDQVQALAVVPVPVPAPVKTLSGSAICPLCDLRMPVVMWQGIPSFPAHNLDDGNDCKASYQPINQPHEAVPFSELSGKFEGFEKIEALVPQTAGDAVVLYPAILEKIEGHEWDNRTTSENAAWLIRELLLRAFPVDPRPTKRKPADKKKKTATKSRRR